MTAPKMRHIKKSQLLARISEDWLARAETLTDDLNGKNDAEIKVIIKANAPLWSELKSHMSGISHSKCWYSEARIAITELEVEHFRPKGRVTGVTPVHKGYWWLAFDWNNYRLSYSLINKRRTDVREGNVQGKGCYFPLQDESARVPDVVAASVAGERPTLIDPFNAADVKLLDYAVEHGKVIPRPSKLTNPAKWFRADQSIYLYHLNEGTLIQSRAEIYSSLVHLANIIDPLFAKEDAGILTDSEDANLTKALAQVGEVINSGASFSSFARACLLQMGDLGWNTELMVAA